MVQDVVDGVTSTQQITVSLQDDAHSALAQLCLADLSNGGRGIRNKIESHFINPLARALFDAGVVAGDKIVVEAISRDEGGISTLTLSVTKGQGEGAV